jgi:hypothetical protein
MEDQKNIMALHLCSLWAIKSFDHPPTPFRSLLKGLVRGCGCILHVSTAESKDRHCAESSGWA